ncbi:hypothetical protein [Duganella levis]|uniref:Uncharacterized protein n=1 Tax=Duganella levis TaxID=2692169 RepID=A0ABW9VT76_9BURK|nr:hypothetical protein [Duganella levis]MYN24823.1 hypothetical protein [Duganella levis]
MTQLKIQQDLGRAHAGSAALRARKDILRLSDINAHQHLVAVLIGDQNTLRQQTTPRALMDKCYHTSRRSI